MTPEVVIHRGVRLEPPAIAALFAAASWHDESQLPLENLDRAFNDSSISISAWSADSLVGVVRATHDGMYAFVWNLVVHPAFRGTGVGHALVSGLFEEFEARQIDWIAGLAMSEHAGRYTEFGLYPVTRLAVVSNYVNL